MNLFPGKVSGPTYSVTNLAKQINGIGEQYKAHVISTNKHFNESCEINNIAVHTFDYLSRSAKHDDILVINGIFELNYLKIVLLCRKLGCRLIISPRSSLIKQSFRKSFTKKSIFILIFMLLIKRNKTTLHFLSMEEKANSFNIGLPSYIACNGFDTVRLDMAKGKFISYLGRYDINHKGIDILLDAIFNSRAIFRKNKWIFRFAGSDFKGGYSYIEKYIHERKLNDFVEIHGPKFGVDKYNYLAESSAMVQPSRYEGVPQTILEAISYGAYVICSDMCNVGSIVKSYDAGISLCSINSRSISVEFEKVITGAYKTRVEQNDFRNDFSWNNVSKDFIRGLSNE